MRETSSVQRAITARRARIAVFLAPSAPSEKTLAPPKPLTALHARPVKSARTSASGRPLPTVRLATIAQLVHRLTPLTCVPLELRAPREVCDRRCAALASTSPTRCPHHASLALRADTVRRRAWKLPLCAQPVAGADSRLQLMC